MPQASMSNISEISMSHLRSEVQLAVDKKLFHTLWLIYSSKLDSICL